MNYWIQVNHYTQHKFEIEKLTDTKKINTLIEFITTAEKNGTIECTETAVEWLVS